jgi:putative Mg2+ transporter-C (MgtC) family protein
MDDQLEELLVKLGTSLLIGILIGGEREYRNKSAGLRTIILICLGSTIFTIISMKVSHETEIGRIASNIITGIGFLGAGAIMRDGLSVSGLTTASTIWVSAALGMAVGFGEFELAIYATITALIVLVIFNYFQRGFDRLRKTLELKVVFRIDNNGVDHLEQKMNEYKLKFDRKRERRQEGDVKFEYEVIGSKKRTDRLVQYLIGQNEKVKAFEY